ncbi:hypothetical protein GCM10025857_52480 [Alicyclobacillus contaminans]|nr:hypothetical protein GCM10025857_52480 [Alicyclobacillus contaminans]
MPEEWYIIGKIAAVFFRNPNNFYKVLLVKISETNMDSTAKEIVVTGSFGEIQEEELYRFLESPSFIPNMVNSLKLTLTKKNNQLQKMGLSIIFQVIIFQVLEKKQQKKLSIFWAKMLLIRSWMNQRC